jgi:hypothetical protein
MKNIPLVLALYLMTACENTYKVNNQAPPVNQNKMEVKDSLNDSLMNKASIQTKLNDLAEQAESIKKTGNGLK